MQTQAVFGQVDEGSINGTVTDAANAIIPNAHVTLLNTDQGLTLETVTNGSGVYIFSPVRIGHYSVTVTAPGFSTTSQKNLTVSVGQNLQVNVELKLGETTTTVDVTTAPPQLETDESSVGQVMTERTVNSLPLNGRNFTFLAQLGAGVNSSQADTRGNAASGAFTANGLRPAQNNYLLDGIDNNSNAVDFLNGTNFVILPPLDAIQEFKVQTADFSAELGRSAGAVLNATIKSGTNSLHGAVWEFFRNDVLDAKDYFEVKKGELRFNQFGATIGGPIIKNKLFFFGDYEGFRRVQGNTQSGIAVPTNQERNSGYTNLSEVITGQSGAPRTDNVGRSIPFGTIMDPATTRAVTAGALDPVSGFVAAKSGYVRDPFGSCGAGTLTYTLAGCNLNQIPASRLDANAIGLLNLYPLPTASGITSNFVTSPNLFEHRNAFDVRGDFNPTQKEQFFVRFSYVDDPQFIPGPFGGVADGGSFQQGLQTAKSDQAVAAWTHVFTPDVVNVARVGFNHLHTTRFGPEGTTQGIPAKYGIQGIPQSPENGGLPAIVIGGLQELGSNDFLPSDEVSQTLQITDDFTKIYGKHSFKTGIEFQNVHFNTLQPAYSRGEFDFNGNYEGVPGQSGDQTGIAQFLVTPTAGSSPTAVNFVGGASEVKASNISKTYDTRKYFAAYFQDDWKVSSKLTLNLGLRWDYFSPISESNGAQANFVQSGPPNGVPTYLIPASGKADRSLSSTANNPSLNGNGFIDLLAKDGITLEETNRYAKALTQTQKSNFAPRAGFAYQITPKFVMRGGVGLFYNSFENQGYGPNIGENYPFVYNFDYKTNGSDSAPFGAGPNPYGTCATSPGGSAPIGTGLTCSSFTPLAVNAAGLSLQGLQFKYITPTTLAANFTLQYAITSSMSAQVAYVFTEGNNLQVGIGNNDVSTFVPANTSTTPFVPFPDFSQGASYQQTVGISNYSGLQTKLEQQFSSGLNYLVTYTYSKTLSDALDLLNGGSLGGFRAPYVPGLGPRFDYGPADFDIRNVVHISGGYQLPFGKDKKFMASAGKLENAVIGGWAVNWIVTLQGGQPITLSCPTGTTSGTNCFDLKVPGQSQKLGLHTDSNGKLNWFGNPAAFQQPCLLGPGGPIIGTPTGCTPLTGAALLGDGEGTTTGPGFHRFDFSAFKAMQLSERFSLQFRAEFFNILNHPNFNSPNFGGNGVTAVSNSGNFTSGTFGEIGSTRDAPYDPRQIQFALKLYY
ncbi:carboxypeptidase regulatory-like domain-containing protein [Tunturiibacter lichenicola]|uniref:carboxypeptidase-like regulatory domain-containing protein n=1 Tax=Tunturiibacter lichenicola TaxID=2051959 RepID=UPI003D9BB9F3